MNVRKARTLLFAGLVGLGAIAPTALPSVATAATVCANYDPGPLVSTVPVQRAILMTELAQQGSLKILFALTPRVGTAPAHNFVVMDITTDPSLRKDETVLTLDVRPSLSGVRSVHASNYCGTDAAIAKVAGTVGTPSMHVSKPGSGRLDSFITTSFWGQGIFGPVFIAAFDPGTFWDLAGGNRVLVTWIGD